MKKLFKDFSIKNFAVYFVICLIYPLIRSLLSNNKLLVFSDTLLIMALLYTVVGILKSFANHGDFDITSFIALRTFNKNITYDKYKKDKLDKRKGSFNYHFLVGIISIIISFIISIFA